MYLLGSQLQSVEPSNVPNLMLDKLLRSLSPFGERALDIEKRIEELRSEIEMENYTRLFEHIPANSNSLNFPDLDAMTTKVSLGRKFIKL